MIKIGEGHKSEVFELPDGRILKLFFPHFAELAPQEAEIAKVLAAAGVRAPRVDETLDTEGRPGLAALNAAGQPHRLGSPGRLLALHALSGWACNPRLPGR